METPLKINYRDLILKLLKILALDTFFSVSTLANASLMLTDDDFITVDHNGIDLDWAWASNYNVQYYYSDAELFNELFAPTIIDGWRVATTEEFSFFSNNVTALNFRRDTGGYKNAVKFFNSNDTLAISAMDFNDGDISGEFREDAIYDTANFLKRAPNSWFDTFYVRNALPQGPKPIPEPLTIIIFATALIALQIKLRKKSV